MGVAWEGRDGGGWEGFSGRGGGRDEAGRGVLLLLEEEEEEETGRDSSENIWKWTVEVWVNENGIRTINIEWKDGCMGMGKWGMGVWEWANGVWVYGNG